MENSDKFINEFVPRVSRTFSLAMQFLPERLRRSINSAYLLCRLIDTIEDSPRIQSVDKISRLKYLNSLHKSYSAGRILHISDYDNFFESLDLDESLDHKLLSEYRILFEIIEKLPLSHRNIIYRWSAEMAEGMAEYVELKQEPGCSVVTLNDLKDWDRYCYYVAGTVGQMLTELFIEELQFTENEISALISHSNSFGLGLQKVNTIKDIPGDRERGIIYIPLEIIARHSLHPDSLNNPAYAENIAALARELVNLARNHLDDAIEYTKIIPESENGIRMFLIVPIFLAVETLIHIYGNPVQAICGPPVKISRTDVVRLTSQAAFCSTSNKKLVEYYQNLKKF